MECPTAPGSPARVTRATRGSTLRAAAGLGVGAISLGVKLAFAAVAIGLPLGAMWIASSLAAHRGSSITLAVVCGLAVWPVLPLVWEGLARWRAHRRSPGRPTTLTPYDRLILRSVAVGLVANAVLLVGFPSSVFTALASRGDWMLADRTGPIADPIRDGLRRAAGALEWLHESTHRNSYREVVADEATHTDSEVTPSDDDSLRRVVEEMTQRPTDGDAPGFAPSPRAWPFVAELHPAVVAMPADAERSLEEVGRHLGRVEPDVTLRVKAVHDYVASRIAYDVASYRSGDIPTQAPQVVFANRLGVCAGYAQLAAAIGDAAGLEIVVVVGDARSPGEGAPSGEGHAWNAARIGDRWVLFDATWDAGSVDGDRFAPEYRADYLMAPPEVFGNTHFPDEPRWQLRATPLDRAGFIAAPSMAPGFHARGLALRSPASGRARVGAAITVELDNPLGLAIRGDVARDGASINFDFCEGSGSTLRCGFERAGRYRVRLWDADAYLGSVEVDADP